MDEDMTLLSETDAKNIAIGSKFWFGGDVYTVLSQDSLRNNTICRKVGDRYNNHLFHNVVKVKPVENYVEPDVPRRDSRPGDSDWLDHLRFVSTIAHEDVEAVNSADRIYNGSWKRRGGVGAFMMLCRKWDRLEHRTENCNKPWDVFHAILTDTRREGCIDDVRDLRRYLLLVEAEMRQRGFKSGDKKLEDSDKKKGGD